MAVAKRFVINLLLQMTLAGQTETKGRDEARANLECKSNWPHSDHGVSASSDCEDVSVSLHGATWLWCLCVLRRCDCSQSWRHRAFITSISKYNNVPIFRHSNTSRIIIAGWHANLTRRQATSYTAKYFPAPAQQQQLFFILASQHFCAQYGC